MRYVRAQDIFPEELLEQIQKLVDGEYVYIPRKDENRLSWVRKMTAANRPHCATVKLIRHTGTG